jgi:hypothetical protein
MIVRLGRSWAATHSRAFATNACSEPKAHFASVDE